MVKRVRGVAFATRVSPQMCNRLVDGARGVLNALLSDVYIFTDHMVRLAGRTQLPLLAQLLTVNLRLTWMGAH